MLILSKHSKNTTHSADASNSKHQDSGGFFLSKRSGVKEPVNKYQAKPSSLKVEDTPIKTEYQKVEATLPVFPDPSLATAVALLNMNNTLLYTMLK